MTSYLSFSGISIWFQCHHEAEAEWEHVSSMKPRLNEPKEAVAFSLWYQRHISAGPITPTWISMFYKPWLLLCTAPHWYSWWDETWHGQWLHPGVAWTCVSYTTFRKNHRRCAHHELGPIVSGPTCLGSCGLEGSLG